jgi:hypothetical protein
MDVTLSSSHFQVLWPATIPPEYHRLRDQQKAAPYPVHHPAKSF